MIGRVFLDANIFFAAAGSPKGGSSFVLELAKKKKFAVVTVTHALAEAEKNIKQKLGKTALIVHYQNIFKVNPRIQPIGSISVENIAMVEKLVPLKDVPILLGAILSNSQFLLTLDKKDFLENQRLKLIKLPFQILNPGDFLKLYLKDI